MIVCYLLSYIVLMIPSLEYGVMHVKVYSQGGKGINAEIF